MNTLYLYSKTTFLFLLKKKAWCLIVPIVQLHRSFFSLLASMLEESAGKRTAACGVLFPCIPSELNRSFMNMQAPAHFFLNLFSILNKNTWTLVYSHIHSFFIRALSCSNEGDANKLLPEARPEIRLPRPMNHHTLFFNNHLTSGGQITP